MNAKKIGIGCGGLFIVFVFLVLLVADDEVTTVTTNSPTKELSATTQSDVELLSWDLVVNNDGEKHLVGKAKNNTGRDLSYLEATFIYYDANGGHLGASSLLNTTDLEAGGIWNFDDELFDDKITQAKFKKFEYQF